VQVGDVPGLAGDLTLEVWVKPTEFSALSNPIGKAYWGEGTITLAPNGALVFYHGSGGSDTNDYEGFGSAALLPLGEWSHVVVTRAGSTITWYLNGVVANRRQAVEEASKSPLGLVIGDGYAGAYLGGLDEAAAYDRALTRVEIASHYATMAAGDHAAYGAEIMDDSPIGYWRLDETVGALARDETGNWDGSYVGALSLGEPGADVR